jgi:hypothetical protein
MTALDDSSPMPRWLIPALWVVLGGLLLALIGVAVFLLIRMDFFAGDSLSNEEVKTM